MKKITDTVSAVTVMLCIMSLAVVLTLAFRPLYYFDIDYLEIEESSGYPEKEIRENYDALISYNLSPFEKKLEFPSFPMSEEAEIHFTEVKNIFQFFLKLCCICGPVSVILIMWKRKREEYGYLKAAGIATIAVPAVMGLFIGLNWERAFVLFHELVFQNDYWIFDSAADPVINILPDRFFLHCAVMILGIIAAGAAVCLAGYSIGKRKGGKS
ncbi:MAG: TIGR01906 family membrane protein [Eubacteriales bacterium]|nr:TIGR01906 family membrane protein [Eubacteriales bacterium]